MKFIRLYWAEIVLFTVAVICNGIMDILNFRHPRGSGFWSIDESLVLDGWHLFKYIMMAALVAAIAVKKRYWAYLVAALALINYAFHEFILHVIGG